MDITGLRQEYTQARLDRSTLDQDPLQQFQKWFEQAVKAELTMPNAMTLATADKHGAVSARTVLLKTYDQQGFVFFTNYHSKKARQIAQNNQVALLFPWLQLERQVKIIGRASKISTAESLRYFVTRPKGSQIGAWCSPQSDILSSRQVLEMKINEMKRKFANKEIPLPDFWGGYRVRPDIIEFWQGRSNRLHDRFQYQRQAEGNWQIDRLAP